MLKTGFARVDITPPMGLYIEGYYEPRIAEGVRDALECNALAASDGVNTVVVLALDLIGIKQSLLNELREGVARAIGVARKDVFVTCSHTHTAPCIVTKLFPSDEAYNARLAQLLAQAAVLAVNDLAPTRMLYNTGRVEGISFIRRYLMKDGTTRTNPGRRNPDIVRPIGEADEQLKLVRLVRENAPEILLTNFQVHPDVVSGCLYSADYPGFVRRTLERALPGAHAIHLNGAAGDLNHIDVNCPEWDENGGYEHARHMGMKIAGEALGLYQKARPLSGDTVWAIEEEMDTPANKGTPDRYPMAENYVKWHAEGRDDLIPETGMGIITLVAEAVRMLALKDAPDAFKLNMTAMRIGELCFAGIPGEGFNEIGRRVKAASPFACQFVCGLAGGNEGYYPMRDSFEEGGYEARSSYFKAGVGEQIADAGIRLVQALHKEA